MSAATVLVVDYEPEILNVVSAMLARSQFDVVTARSAGDARSILRRKRVDVVLSAVVMPAEGGPELVRFVRQSYPSTAVMLMTGFTEERLDPTIVCVEKPFTVDTLISRVREVLARTRQVTHTLNEAFERNRTLREQTEAIGSDFQNTLARSRESRWESRLQNGSNRPTVLVAEDDPAFRYAVSHFLSAKGFTVLDAATHDEAVCLWRDHHDRIDVLVTDLHGVDGLELADAVEADCPDEPIIFITGAPATGLPHPTLRKPFPFEDLLATIQRALGRE
jgi:DNA-binding response OmpR family regulator